MDQFPSNSRRPQNSVPDEPKKIDRIVQGEVVRRKTPLGRRMAQNLIGGDVQSVWGYVFGEVLIPAARDMVADAVSGGVERMIFGDSSPASRRSRGTRNGSSNRVPYNNYSHPAGRAGRPDGDNRQISQRARATHAFDEIILTTRVEAEEVMDRLGDLVERYELVTVSDLYRLVGVTGTYTDEKWGWEDLRTASISRIRNGYLLNLPRPEPV